MTETNNQKLPNGNDSKKYWKLKYVSFDKRFGWWKKQQKTKEREMISKPDRDVSNILWLEKLFYSDLAKTDI